MLKQIWQHNSHTRLRSENFFHDRALQRSTRPVINGSGVCRRNSSCELQRHSAAFPRGRARRGGGLSAPRPTLNDAAVPEFPSAGIKTSKKTQITLPGITATWKTTRHSIRAGMLAGHTYENTSFSDPLANAASRLGHNLPDELRSCRRSSAKKHAGKKPTDCP